MSEDAANQITLDQAIAQMRRLRPSRLVAQLQTGDPQPLSLAGRRPWQRIREMLLTMEWLYCDAFDSTGALLKRVASGATAAAEAPTFGALAATMPKEAALLSAVVECTDRMLARNQANLDSLLSAQTNVLNGIASRLGQLESGYADVLRLARQAAETVAAPSDNGGSDLERVAAQVIGDVVARSLPQSAKDAIAGVVGRTVQTLGAGQPEGKG